MRVEKYHYGLIFKKRVTYNFPKMDKFMVGRNEKYWGSLNRDLKYGPLTLYNKPAR